jgi:hypothetical protein
LKVLDQGLGQHDHVGDGQVHALGPGGRHDVGGVAGQEQPAVAHGLGDEAAQRRDRLLERRAARDPGAGFRAQAQAQLVPEPLVAPVLDLLVETALDVVAAAGGERIEARAKPRSWLE